MADLGIITFRDPEMWWYFGIWYNGSYTQNETKYRTAEGAYSAALVYLQSKGISYA